MRRTKSANRARLFEPAPVLPAGRGLKMVLRRAATLEKRRVSKAMPVACASVGGQAALARAIGRPEETVGDWATGKPSTPSLWSRSSASPALSRQQPAARPEPQGIYKRFYDPPELMSASLGMRSNCCRAEK